MIVYRILSVESFKKYLDKAVCDEVFRHETTDSRPKRISYDLVIDPEKEIVRFGMQSDDDSVVEKCAPIDEYLSESGFAVYDGYVELHRKN